MQSFWRRRAAGARKEAEELIHRAKEDAASILKQAREAAQEETLQIEAEVEGAPRRWLPQPRERQNEAVSRCAVLL